MTRFRTPNFRGRHAIILHRSSKGTGQLARQLERLGMTVEVCWPDFPAEGSSADVVFFDADNGFDGLFPWAQGEAPMPLIALLGSELPGRLEWALAQGIASHVVKPVQSSGVFSALVIAASNFDAAKTQQEQFEELQARLGRRPDVIRAVVNLMQLGLLDEDTAFSCLRSAAMDERITIEEFCSRLDADRLAQLIRHQSRDKWRVEE
ncbi:ANTAR domain-containing response regulator [Pelagibius sp. Alg239-R121]|uniref:ANTAR domain-containing response regulator n=1 Tax=Pelagibius sp. Alg239-R121 TaxID=2993448 RepID=UPI0024A64364|nr:ANTAR domain-containing protein [Pelagibius sp. Alg239-R121]